MDTIINRIQFAFRSYVSVALLLLELCDIYPSRIHALDRGQKIQGLILIIASHVRGDWRDRRYIELTVILKSHHFLLISLLSLHQRSWLDALDAAIVVGGTGVRVSDRHRVIRH